MAEKGIEEVLRTRSAELLAVPGVVGAAQGLCFRKPCIKVFVVAKTGALERTLPDSLDGFPVEIEEAGEIRDRPED